jgi:hypothetical protein
VLFQPSLFPLSVSISREKREDFHCYRGYKSFLVA